MGKIADQLAIIVRELNYIQQNPKRTTRKFEFLSLIDSGDGRSIELSPKIDGAIEAIANELWAERRIEQTHTKSEWKKMVRAAFGPALASLSIPADAARDGPGIITKVNYLLDQQQTETIEHTFGCSLFGANTVRAFTLGSATLIEPRTSWVERKVSEGALSATAARRLLKQWQGSSVRPRKPSGDTLTEDAVRKALGNALYVCTVKTSGLAPSAAQERAHSVARLALTAISLMWRTPSAALRGMNLVIDGPAFQQVALKFRETTQRPLVGFTWSNDPHGPRLSQSEWDKAQSDANGIFEVIGETLDALADIGKAPQRPRLTGMFAQALLWFSEGCRNRLHLGAIINFMAVLDALASGHKEKGILKLINARLKLGDHQPIRPGGPTLQTVIRELYGEGRSRTIHGTNDKLGRDWAEARGLAEQFARLCLITSLDTVATTTHDDPSRLLNP